MHWLERITGAKQEWYVPEKNIFAKINATVIEEYKNRLLEARLSPLSINRKLSSLRRYVSWAKSENLIPSLISIRFEEAPIILDSTIKKPIDLVINEGQSKKDYAYSKFPPLRLIQKSFRGSTYTFDTFIISPLSSLSESIEYALWKLKGEKVFKPSALQNPQATKSVYEIENFKKTQTY